MSSIIHVDNSEFFRKQMKTFLSEIGLDPQSFACGEDAINAVKTGKATTIITGLELSDMTGEEFIKRLAVIPGSVPVIVVTSNNKEVREKRLVALGAMAIIGKSGDWKGELGKILK